MTIRTRAFLALGLITFLVVGISGFITVALKIAGDMDAERERVQEVLSVHGSLWRTLVELKHDQRELASLGLPSIQERRQRDRQAVND